MTDIKLLPLPDELQGLGKSGAIEDYAIANVLHHTAPLQYALDNAARSIKSLRGVMDSYAAEIEALRAEVRTLVRQNGEWQARAERLQEEIDNRWATGVHTCHAACQRTACVLRRDNERLAEALRPLAELDLTPDDFDQRPDSQPIYARNKTAITVGDVRKACAALEQERRPTMAGDLIEYLRGVAENANLPQYMRDRLTEAADALRDHEQEVGNWTCEMRPNT